MAITLEGTTYTDGTTTWSPNRDGAYEIGSLDQLKFFRDAVNDGNTFAGQTVLLTASIDLNNEEWTPIGKSGKTFQGTFDGQGNTVSNLYINTPTQSDVGFFGFTTVGEIKNLTIENANVTGYLDVGAVAGTPYTSKYTNITLKGEVKVQGFAYVGGMFGKNVYANLTDLTIDAAEGSYVTADSVEGNVAYRTYVGGVIGFMGESESNSIVVKNVTSNINVSGSTCDIGGITGIAHYGNSFINVTCTAKEVVLVNAADEGDQYEVGGIAGVWNNEPERIVQFINCSVENTEIKSSLNGVEQDVSANTMSGNAYVRDDTGTGSLLIGQNVVIEEDGKYSAGEFTVSGPNAVNVLNGKLADGLTVYPSADGTLEVDVTGYVAAIGDTRYTTAKEALTVANELRGATIDLMEGTYSYVAPTTSSDVKITNAGTYNIINGDGVLLNYDLDVNPDLADGEYILSMTNANLTLTKLTLRSNSSLTVTDSRIDYNAYEGGSAYLSVYNNSVLNVSNSTIGFDPHQSGVDDPSLLPAAGTGAMDPYWNWAPTWNIYGTATIENSTLFAYVGQGNQAGFDVRGNGTATVIGSELSAALVNVGTDYDSAKLEPGADENNLSATLIFDSTTVKNTQYRGDYNTNNGIDIGQADGSTAVTLLIRNKSDVDFTILDFGDDRQIGLRFNNAKSSVEISDSTVKLPSVTNSGSITLGSASKLLADSVTNAGTISLDYTSTLAFEDIANSGTITIDMDGFSGGLYKLLDYTGSDSRH